MERGAQPKHRSVSMDTNRFSCLKAWFKSARYVHAVK